MVDIETLGTEPGCVVLSIGAVRFSASGGLGEEFYESVDPDSALNYGLEIDPDTREWWARQPEDARAVLHDGHPLTDALEAFSAFYGEATELWAYSPIFDVATLGAAYDAVGIREPWTYDETRDARTMASLAVSAEPERRGTEHHALDDAKHQARMVADALGRIPERDGDE